MPPNAKGRPAKDASGKTQLQLATEAGVSLATWKLWQSDKKLSGQALADRKKQAEIRRIDLEAEKAQRMLAVLDAEYYPRAEVNEAIAHLAAVDDEFDSALLSEGPALLDGLKAPQIEIELRKFVDEWKAKRADARSEVHQRARAAIQRELRGDLKKVARSQNGKQ